MKTQASHSEVLDFAVPFIHLLMNNLVWRTENTPTKFQSSFNIFCNFVKTSMPKIAIYQAFTFYMFIYDVLNEPPHLHITKNKKGYNNSAKIWLESLIFAEFGDFTEKELNLIEKLVIKNQASLLKSFNNVKLGKKTKAIKLKL